MALDGKKTYAAAATVVASAVAAVVAGDAPWWSILLALGAAGGAAGLRHFAERLPALFAGQLREVLTSVADADALAVAAAALPAEGRAKIRAALDAADAAPA